MVELPTIIQIGDYPPPVGGVTIHIKRLYQRLTKKGIRCKVLYSSKIKKNHPDLINVKNIYFLGKTILDTKCIYHFHLSGLSFINLIMFRLMRSKKKIITFHSLRDEIDSMGSLKKWLLKKVLHDTYRIIVTNDIIKSKIDNLLESQLINIDVIPAFIRPNENELNEGLINEELNEFLKTHSPVIISNAYKIIFYQGEDLYGIDKMIELCEELKKKNKQIGVVIFLPDINDRKYYNELNKKIIDKKIEKNFTFTQDERGFLPMLARSDAFIRATNSDGDSLSVRESLSLSIPTYTTDVVERPDGCINFNRDQIDNLVSLILDQSSRDNYHKMEHDVFYNKIENVYKSLIQ